MKSCLLMLAALAAVATVVAAQTEGYRLALLMQLVVLTVRLRIVRAKCHLQLFWSRFWVLFKTIGLHIHGRRARHRGVLLNWQEFDADNAAMVRLALRYIFFFWTDPVRRKLWSSPLCR